jgi:hypothetical protein
MGVPPPGVRLTGGTRSAGAAAHGVMRMRRMAASASRHWRGPDRAQSGARPPRGALDTPRSPTSARCPVGISAAEAFSPVRGGDSGQEGSGSGASAARARESNRWRCGELTTAFYFSFDSLASVTAWSAWRARLIRGSFQSGRPRNCAGGKESSIHNSAGRSIHKGTVGSDSRENYLAVGQRYTGAVRFPPISKVVRTVYDQTKRMTEEAESHWPGYNTQARAGQGRSGANAETADVLLAGRAALVVGQPSVPRWDSVIPRCANLLP